MANRWTDEQLLAIEKEGTNIIVSAGAGSGKTAVLTERVLRKVKEGTHIDELLIMTFTNAAAKEMKDRIRKKLKKEELFEEVNLIDSSYITTFDSFSLSIVKKYHYVLNIGKNIKIADSFLLNIEKNKIIDQIFDEYYLKNNERFNKFIKDFCYKDDKELKRLILKLNDKLDMRYDKNSYLNNYINSKFSTDSINLDINNYFNEIKLLIDDIEEVLNELSLHLDGVYIEKLQDCLNKLLNSKNYDDVVTSLDFRLSPLPKNSPEEAKIIKSRLSDIIKDIKKLCIYKDKEEIKNEILSTKDNILTIVTILLDFDSRFNKLKLENNLFSFNDISKMAIKIVEENKDIREELTKKFNEIMVDEYQDTNDIQEYFVSLISKNNVYMVGDIKQSIYRFRNANPYIFKNKYDNYSKNDGGLKIDLLKNFRSRQEVLENINLVFDLLMDDFLGGADYKKSHRMIFGNTSYNIEGKTGQDYDFEILTYDTDDKKFTKCEKEIFIIGNDIKNKIDNKYKIFDKDEKIVREINYSDFVILIDRTSDFEQYKKVFEYLNIPLTLYKDEEIASDLDILIIRNILKVVRAIDKKEFNEEFKYAFLSVGRSFLFNLSDNEIFECFSNNCFKDNIVYSRCEKLHKYYYELSPKMFFLKLLDIFNYDLNLLKIGNVKVGRVRCEYFYNLLSNLEESGKTIDEFIEYLDIIFDNEEKVTFSLNNNSSNSVKIMTIHKSKGLEFPICYFAGFDKSFSFRELNDSILYSDKYGIIVPYFNNYVKDTIYKTLLKLDTKKEEISEKIRLLYVAVTRAKEKMIIVMPKVDEEKIIDSISLYEKKKMKSFYDMIKLVYFDVEKYVKNIEVSCSKDYLINKNNLDYHDLVEKDNLVIEEVSIEKEELNEEKFSKSENKLITKDEKEKMNFGIKIHEILEFIDFKNPDYSSLTNFEKRKVESFINSDIIKKNIDSKFYKEYEFSYLKDDIVKNGIIDLMIENEEKIIIVDYKLKNISDPLYNKQLFGYRDYISDNTNKDVCIYLYSIIDEKFEKI